MEEIIEPLRILLDKLGPHLCSSLCADAARTHDQQTQRYCENLNYNYSETKRC